MIFFKCVGCGAALQVGNEWAGKPANCPYCQAISPVPYPQLQPASYPKRTSKLKILARFCAYPLAVTAFWAFFLGTPVIIGGLAAIAGIVLYLWDGTNLLMWISSPGSMKLWKSGGGDLCDPETVSKSVGGLGTKETKRPKSGRHPPKSSNCPVHPISAGSGVPGGPGYRHQSEGLQVHSILPHTRLLRAPHHSSVLVFP